MPLFVITRTYHENFSFVASGRDKMVYFVGCFGFFFCFDKKEGNNFLALNILNLMENISNFWLALGTDTGLPAKPHMPSKHSGNGSVAKWNVGAKIQSVGVCEFCFRSYITPFKKKKIYSGTIKGPNFKSPYCGEIIRFYVLRTYFDWNSKFEKKANNFVCFVFIKKCFSWGIYLIRVNPLFWFFKGGMRGREGRASQSRRLTKTKVHVTFWSKFGADRSRILKSEIA